MYIDNFDLEKEYHEDLQDELMDISNCKGVKIEETYHVFQASMLDYEVMLGCDDLSAKCEKIEQLNYAFDQSILYINQTVEARR